MYRVISVNNDKYIMKIKAVTEVEVSDEDLFDAIKEKVGLSDYTIIDGVLKHYDRVSWEDYDWVTLQTRRI